MIKGLGMVETLASSGLDSELLSALKPWVTELRQFWTGLEVEDSSLKFMAFDHMGREFAVVSCSPPVKPDLVSEELQTKESVKRALGALGDVVLEPMQSGSVQGLSYAIYPYCQPLYRRRLPWAAQRLWVRERLLTWLQAATQTTVQQPTDREIVHCFADPLRRFSEWNVIPAEAREAASTALRRLDAGSWQPRFCLMHCDLGHGNILLAPGSRSWRRFVLIDWGASLVRGYGTCRNDLVRMEAPYMNLKGRRLAREVEAHCRILGCETADARSHLIAALAHIGMPLGGLPIDRYVRLCSWCIDWLGTQGTSIRA